MSATVKVHLLGRDYALRSDGDPAMLHEAASLVEKKIAGLVSAVSVDTCDRQVLVMLNLAGELLQEKHRCQGLEIEVQELRRVGDAAAEKFRSEEARLIERIEGALKR